VGREEAAVSDGGGAAEGLLCELRGDLELDLAADGVPANPLVVVELDRWRDAADEVVARAAGLVAAALPVTVGVVCSPTLLFSSCPRCRSRWGCFAAR
jgi:hypothetical protein